MDWAIRYAMAEENFPFPNHDIDSSSVHEDYKKTYDEYRSQIDPEDPDQQYKLARWCNQVASMFNRRSGRSIDYKLSASNFKHNASYHSRTASEIIYQRKNNK